jgi:NADH dehydrogenase FAD-containing subunit
MEVVIIGAGYAGLLAAVRLARRLRRQPATITLVNAADVFVERLRLHQFATNQPVTRRPLIDILRGTGINFVQGYVTQLDPARRTLTVRTNTEVRHIGYDQLLYALGSTIERDSVPGVREYAYTLAPSGPLSAAALRERLPALNQAGGRVVICGAGATGIETAAEFAATYPQLRVHLITRGAIGRRLDPPITAYIRRSLEQLGVTLQDHTIISEVGPGAVYTGTGPVAADLCVGGGGFVAPPLARAAGLAVNERGQILIDPFMRSISHPDILVAGDAAYPVEEPGAPVRMSAVTATILGAHAADCLSATLRGHAPKPLSFAYLGQGIALGRHNAIGFNNYPDDRPRAPYITGRLGYELREFFVRYLADAASLERRGLTYFWLGKGRYAAAQRRGPQRAPIDSAL